MIFLLDSNAFSDLMHKDPRVEAHLAALDPNDQVVICSVVRGEILYGLTRLPEGRRRVDLTRQAAPLFASITCQPGPEAAGDAYAKIKRPREQHKAWDWTRTISGSQRRHWRLMLLWSPEIATSVPWKGS